MKPGHAWRSSDEANRLELGRGNASEGVPAGPEKAAIGSREAAEADVWLQRREAIELLRERLRRPLLQLVPHLTGVRLGVFWHAPQGEAARGEIGLRCPVIRPLGPRWLSLPAHCQSCLRQHWPRTQRAAELGHRFFAPCSRENLWATLAVDGLRPLTLTLQSSAGPGRKAHPQAPEAGAGSPAAFERSVALVRLILHDLTAAVRAQVLERKLHEAERALAEMACEDGQLRDELQRRLPELPGRVSPPPRASRTGPLLAQMIDYARQHVHRPLTLRQVAVALGHNASYLSTLFSRSTGLSFHFFLEQTRLAKAKELLRDGHRSIAEVACASGYASEDWFRHAFKHHTGLCPSAWRAMQA